MQGGAGSIAARALSPAHRRRFLLATSGGHHEKVLFVLALAALGLLALLVVPAAALASAATFYVHPRRHNDTANIQTAFNAAVKAGPGSTVQLSAGHFYTNTNSCRTSTAPSRAPDRA